MKKIVVSLLISSSIITTCYSQATSSKILTVDELFELADANNRAMKLSDLTLQESAQSVKVAKNAKLPSLDISLSAGYLSNIRITDRDFSNGMTVDIKDFGDYAHFTNNLVVEASQILYAGGAIKNSVKNAELSYQAAQFDKTQTQQNIRFLLLSYYLQLFNLSNQEEVFIKNIEQTNKLVSDINNKQKEGLALKNDITRYELQLQSLELSLTHVKNEMSIVNHKLCTLLQLPKETIIEVDKSILETLPFTTNEQDWQATAQDSAPELKKAQIHTEQAINAEKIVNSDRKPKIFVYAADQLDGPITIDMDLKDNNMNLWTIGVGIKYNLASLYTTNRSVKQSKIATQTAQEAENLLKDNIQIEVNTAYTRFNEAYTILATREKSLELATLNYSVINNRYLNDLALITDMLDASNSKLEAELRMADAKINILLSYYNLKRATGTL